MRIFTFDTTLRDGTQGEAVSFTVEDKLLIAQKLDELGIDYIEGGWPGSNPRDKEFFRRAKQLKLKHGKLTAFGSTRHPRNPIHEDQNARLLIEAETPVVSIFGKSWDFHAHRALGVTEEENLALIAETVGYIKARGREIVYDAEHFFDGYLANPAFALRTLEAAKLAGADVLCLCDTNGGTMPERVAEIVDEVRKRFDGILGMHAHNDSDVAVANTLIAVEHGATHVQGCFNGYGERCGNANLCSVIANLELKYGHTTIGPDKLQSLTSLARLIADLANLPVRREQPFVGPSAFAHKGGIHVSAVMKHPATYEHVGPELVGNRRRVLLSDLSGRSNVTVKLDEHGLAQRLGEDAKRELLERIKDLEYKGYELESAEGSFELLVRQALHPEQRFFEIVNVEITTGMSENEPTRSRASVTIRADEGLFTGEADGHGPVHALDASLRQCLIPLYPAIERVRLTDYKVRVLDSRHGTAAKVRVLIEWSDHLKSWTTVGVSDNVIEASLKAMADALRLELMRAADPEYANGSVSLQVDAGDELVKPEK